jgi:DNA-binding MarR family transcriptional regulator
MSPDRRPESELVDGLVQVSFAVIALLNRAAAANGMSLTQLRLLGILRDREPTMSALAEHLGLDRSTVSGLIDRAAARGLVRRDSGGDDGRSVRVSLTDEGRALAAAGTDQIHELAAPLLAPLNAADQRRLGALLSRLVDEA